MVRREREKASGGREHGTVSLFVVFSTTVDSGLTLGTADSHQATKSLFRGRFPCRKVVVEGFILISRSQQRRRTGKVLNRKRKKIPREASVPIG